MRWSSNHQQYIPDSPRLIVPDLEIVKPRVIEIAEIDAKHLLRPLLLFRGNITEGKTRAMVSTIVSMMDLDVPSVTEAVKLSSNNPDYGHLCGLHAKQAHHAFYSILGRLLVQRKVADLVPHLYSYVEHLADSARGNVFLLDTISEFDLTNRTKRAWRRKDPLPPQAEIYPYIVGPVTSDHDMLMAVDALVPKGLPDDVRADVCQDMVVAILSGETTVENLKDDRRKYLQQFWQMFPAKYGHISLDSAVPGTHDMRWDDKIDARTARLL